MPLTDAPRRGPKPNPETRKNILHAGVEMIHRGGFSATGIKDIVAHAQVPKGSFYNHFPSKEAFGAEVVDTYFDDNLASLQKLLLDPSSAPLDRLRRYFRERTDRLAAGGFTQGCLLGNLSLEVADHSEVIRDHIAENFDSWQDLFRRCIAEAQDTGAISETISATTLAQYVLDGWEGALLRARTAKTTAPLDNFVEVTFATVLT